MPEQEVSEPAVVEPEQPVVEEPEVVVEEVIPEPIEEESVVDPQLKAEVLPLPEDIPVREEKPELYELEYSILPGGNPVDKLPTSESGNYVVIYRSDNCPYCDKLISELKGNIEDYTLVVVKCSRTVRDVFYSRWIYSYPSFIVITDKKVRYYGYGYRTLEEFKKLL